MSREAPSSRRDAPSWPHGRAHAQFGRGEAEGGTSARVWVCIAPARAECCACGVWDVVVGLNAEDERSHDLILWTIGYEL